MCFYDNALPVIVEGETFMLFAEKAMLWKPEDTLFIADLHLGKAGHFRKQGIPVPVNAGVNNFVLLNSIIDKSRCKKILFLGDLFHSHHNQECELFLEWRDNYPQIAMSLVIGNHDILNEAFYKAAGLSLMKSLCLGSFIFTHKPQDMTSKGYYNIAGHVHPGVRLFGKARQSLSLPCFYFGEKFALMPSFGNFTGNKVIDVKKGDKIYVIADNLIKRIQ
jgi:DNA ligase-associated metallophosphoesterase